MKLSLLTLFVSLILITAVAACTPTNGAMTVTDVWARPMPQRQNGAVYFTIQNHTDTDDQLLAVKSDIASSVEMHLSAMNDKGVMSMSKQDSVKIPIGEMIAFEPGGLHVMLIDLQQDLVIGESFPIMLDFEQAGEIMLQVEIEASP
ncbi:MAG: copper chaperone PCu(A)C [Caldilineales bacterium]|nr:copper chaperone PCu(A)C [Caldilineales bacterium]